MFRPESTAWIRRHGSAFIPPIRWPLLCQLSLPQLVERTRRIIREAEAQRLRYAPKPIIVDDDDLAALGDAF